MTSIVSSAITSSNWDISTSGLGAAASCPPSSTSLNFLVAITTANLRFYTAAVLRLTRLEIPTIGTGGYATVEVGRMANNQLVAVKRSRILSQPLATDHGNAFRKHLDQLCLELRILSHTKLRKHSNILNILGLCVDEHTGQPSLSLVLEYSSLGSLSSFLRDRQGSISASDHVDLAFQTAQGLAALHELQICHGDVKTQNILVFLEEEKWIVKLSDFGQSTIAVRDSPSTTVECKIGTRLLNAPEIRNGLAMNDPSFDIDAAMRTDIFSFGLMIWEVLKNGRSFFDRSWMITGTDKTDVEQMEAYLNSLPPNGVYHYSLAFLDSLDLDIPNQGRLSAVFECSLQDEPQRRAGILTLTKILDCRNDIQE